MNTGYNTASVSREFAASRSAFTFRENGHRVCRACSRTLSATSDAARELLSTGHKRRHPLEVAADLISSRRALTTV